MQQGWSWREVEPIPYNGFAKRNEFSPAAFLQSPASYLYQLFHINGYQLGHSQKGTDVASSTLLGELLKMLRKQGDPAQRTMIVELVEELRTRFVKAESAQRQDLFMQSYWRS